MQVLANALPGIRDLRPPLVAGYFWLLLIWLWAEPHVDSAHASGAVASALELGEAMGHVGIAAAVSAVAYLLGAVSQELSPAVRLFATTGEEIVAPEYIERSAFVGLSEQMVERADIEQSIWLETHRPITHYFLRAQREESAEPESRHSPLVPEPRNDYTLSGRLIEVLKNRESRADIDRRLSALSHFVNELLQRRASLPNQVRDEMRLPANLIIGDHAELFAEVDRLRSESELRLAVVPPLMSLAVFLAIAVSLAWLAVIPVVAMLAIQGTRRYQQSTATVANAAFFGKVRLASIAAYGDWVQQTAPLEPQDLPSDLEELLKSG